MKKFLDFILRGCGYTVMIAFILYTVLAISGVTDQGIPVSKFVAVFAYGLLAAGAQSAYHTLKVNLAIRVAVHYTMLLAGFIALYLTSGVNASVNASKIFIAITIFTLLYALASAFCVGIKNLVSKSMPATSKKPVQEQKPKSEYKPRFGSDS